MCTRAILCAPPLCLGYSPAEGQAAPSVTPVSQGSGRNGEYSAVLESARRAAARPLEKPQEPEGSALRWSPLPSREPCDCSLP